MGGYVGVNNISKKISQGYVGVNGVARKITAGYVGVNGVAKSIWSLDVDPIDFIEGNYTVYENASVTSVGSCPLLPSTEKGEKGIDLSSATFVNATVVSSAGATTYIGVPYSAMHIPNCTIVNDSAFRGDKSIVSIQANWTYVGESAFSSCINLSSISLPNATTIGAYAFFNCGELTNISLPSVENIGDQAFRMFSGPGGYPYIESIKLPHALNIGSQAFYQFDIGEVELNMAQQIGDRAFDVADIVKILSTDVCTITGRPFSSNATIYVPQSLLSAYQARSDWQEYINNLVGV